MKPSTNAIAENFIVNCQADLKPLEEVDSILAGIIERRILLDAELLRGREIQPWEEEAINKLFELHITNVTVTTNTVRKVEALFKQFAVRFNQLVQTNIH